MTDKKKPKTYEKIDPDEIAKALGARRVTDPKEIEEFKRKHGRRSPSLPASKDKKKSD